MLTFPEGATTEQILTLLGVALVGFIAVIWLFWGTIRTIRLPKFGSNQEKTDDPVEEPTSRPTRRTVRPQKKANPRTRRPTRTTIDSTALVVYKGNQSSASKPPDDDDDDNLDRYDENFMYGGTMENQPNEPLGVIGEIRHVPGWIVLVIALITRFFLLPVDIQSGHIGNFMGLWDWRWQLFFFLCCAGIWYYRRISRNPRAFDGVLNGALIFWSIIIVLF